MSDEYYDDGDNGGPTSHRYLYDMPRRELFTLFVAAVQAIRVDGGPLCRPVEAQGLSRMARAVQARVDPDDGYEAKLGGVATVLRVLLSRANGLDKGEDQTRLLPMPDLVGVFVELRAELADMLPVSGAWASMVVVPADPSGVDAVASVRVDGDGRLWTELDPGDEEWSDERIAALPVCDGCREPMIPASGGVPAVDHSGCRKAPGD